MVSSEINEQLVEALSADLAPVHRLAPPRPRAMLWLALSPSRLPRCPIQRLLAAPDLWVAAMGSVLIAVLAAAVTRS